MSDDRYDNHRYHNADTFHIMSTAGAVPVKNSKGEIRMEKVKVQRYISGKRPEYGAAGDRDRMSSDEEQGDSDDDDFVKHHHNR
jgi:microfibrillar-associated protein 1